MTEDERSALAEAMLDLATDVAAILQRIADMRAKFYAAEPPPEAGPPLVEDRS